MKTNYIKKAFIAETDQEFLEKTGFIYLIAVIEIAAVIILQDQMHYISWILLFALCIILCRIGFLLGRKAANKDQERSKRLK